MISKVKRRIKMKTKYILLLAIISLSSFLLTGCYGVSNEFNSIKKLVLKGMDRQYKTDYEFSLGSVSLTMIQGIVQLSDNDDEAAAMLANISNVQVGIYKNEEINIGKQSPPNHREIIRRMENNGWQYIVKSFSPGKVSLIFVGTKSTDKIEDIFIINLENHELAMVEVHGKLDELIGKAIRDKELNLDLSDNF